MADYEVHAARRDVRGRGGMRRLRREGNLPGVLYGAGKDPLPITLRENDLGKQLANEAFFSHILRVRVEGGAEEQAVLKDLQRHPATERVLHVDLMRVSADQEIVMNVPVHFENEEVAPGRKAGGVISHHETEIEISCLPRDLPEYIAVDMSAVELDGSIHLSDIAAPPGVEFLAMSHENDLVIASIALPRIMEEEEAVEGEEEEALGAEAAEPGAAEEPAGEGEPEQE